MFPRQIKNSCFPHPAQSFFMEWSYYELENLLLSFTGFARAEWNNTIEGICLRLFYAAFLNI